MAFRVDVNPAVLQWARQSAGYDIPEVAERCHFPEGSVREWELGQKRPTWTALRKLADIYKRPVAALLLAHRDLL